MIHPPSLAWYKREYTTQGLALTMMAMGTTLSLEVQLSLHSAVAMSCAVHRSFMQLCVCAGMQGDILTYNAPKLLL